MPDTIRVTRARIDELVSKVPYIDHEHREIVRRTLYDLERQEDGVFFRERFHHELYKLRKTHEISDIDLRNIEHAFFG